MNPAKAAPSAPVKKPPGKIRRSSRAACLSYFLPLLAAGEAVQRHHNQHEKADDQQDTGHIDAPARFASDFRVRSPAQSAKVF